MVLDVWHKSKNFLLNKKIVALNPSKESSKQGVDSVFWTPGFVCDDISHFHKHIN